MTESDLIKVIVEEYESFLQEKLITEYGKNSLQKLYMFEGRGFNFNFSLIAQYLMQCIGNFGWKKTAFGYTTFVPGCNGKKWFLSDVELVVNLYENESDLPDNYATTSFAEDDRLYYDVEQDKLHGVLFTYNQLDNEKHKIDRDLYMKYMWHELQHAYRHYRYWKKLYQYQVDGIEREDYEEKHINTFMKSQDLPNSSIGGIINMRALFYYTDRDEIDGHLTSMFPYLKRNWGINFINYKEHLSRIPGYEIIDILKGLTYSFDVAIKDKKIRNEIVKQCRYIFGQQLSEKNAIKQTRNRLKNALLYTEKEFYKKLYTALKELGRRHNFNNWLVRT